MQWGVCSPHPSWPANTLTSGWVRITTEILAGYQGSHLYGEWIGIFDGPVIQLPEVNAEPQAAILLLNQDHCTGPYEEAIIGNAPWRVSNLATSILCLIKVILPRSRSLQTNRCPHLSSSFLACSYFSLGHSPRPWRPRASKIHPFWGLLMDPFKRAWWEGYQWYLVGRYNLANHHSWGDFNRTSGQVA